MELLFVTLGGAILGIGARYVLPHSSEHGVTLIPAVGAAVAAIVWVGLTWLGWKWDGGWIWWVSLMVAAGASVAVDLLIGRARSAADARRLAILTKTGVAAG
ncbi:hypothetical protein [Luethyella okanaganae]|uniref:Uncharacterized protein n=1 Tax=Luethyella okanaganae TaxID=69372 RepID=A0ABW1VDW9_9MICO